ncbi:PREDICTED: deubiquitination-protection protein dph1-like isoform X2 [Nicotiana attenuata]|uniref:deubiquitination-protection protein dph1-like isoform X2 n=1 Tax=Nicotiana attenuata TaxID=49451 RepID=UPI0009054B39|nr:PREDICTED: deubiquitination-protection protein dph1-like isoform X2 [Nicotiana attenuata]
MTHTGEASEGHKSEGIDTTIEIKVKTMNSETHNLRISNQRRVWNLKEHVSLLIGMPMEQQRLIYCGKVLQDDDLLSSYNIQHGDTLHLVCTVQSMSSFAATDEISPDTQQEIPNSLESLSRYLNIMRQEYNMNRTENNTNEVLGSASNTFTPPQGIPEVEQLARLLSSTRDMLISQTAQRFLELELDLRQNLDMGDPRVRQVTQLNAETTIGTMFNNLGAYFLELGRAVMGVQMGDNGSAAVVNAGPAVYITDSGPLSIQEELYSVLLSTIHSLINSGLVNDNDTRLHQRQVGTQMIGGSGVPTEVSQFLRSMFLSGELEAATPAGATVNNVVDNAGILSVSSGPSIIEPRSAHESAGEPANEDVGTSHRQTADFAESPSHAKRQRME